MTITIKSKMRMHIEDGEGKGRTRQFQAELHEGIVQAIMSAVEHARDDTESFDSTALDDLGFDKWEFGIEGTPEICDFAEMNLEYTYGKKTWQGERIPTKEERQTS